MVKSMKVFGLKEKIERYKQSNILIATLLIFLVCSSLMVVILENYRLTIDINQRTDKYYIAKIMKQLALSRITNEKVKGSYQYSTGIIHYTKKDNEIEFRVHIPPYTFQFIEKLNNDTDNDTVNN